MNTDQTGLKMGARKVTATKSSEEGAWKRGRGKALSWVNLRNEVSANIERCYVKVVFFVLVV
jgi:hypothetical protein